MNASYYKKNYAYAGLTVIVALIIYLGAWRLLNQRWIEAEKLLIDKAIAADTASFRTTLTRSLEASREDRNKLEAHFVRRDGIVDFINGLERLGRDSGVESNISSLGESWQEGTGTLSLSLRVAGSFADVYRYLTLLEEVSQDLRFQDIQLSAGDGGIAPVSLKTSSPHNIIWTANLRATVMHYIQ